MEKTNGMEYTKESYEKKYEEGYGVRYPEGHIIRFYERVLRHNANMTSGKSLDFGCGNGIHSKFLQSKGFEVYGVDVSKRAIDEIKNDMEDDRLDSMNFHLIEPGENLLNIFEEGTFDVILANQSLYYLDNFALRECINQLYKLTKVEGICFFSMMSSKNSYYKLVTDQYENGLSCVELNHRLHEKTNINFIESVEELESKFRPYETVHIGQYEPYTYLDMDDEDGCSHHYMFIGRKCK